MAKSKAFEKLQNFKQNMKDPEQAVAAPDIEKVRALVAEGEPVIYLKGVPLKYNGKTYRAGDEIILGKGRYDSSLIEQGMFSSPERFKGSKAYKAQRDFYRESVQPAELKHLAANNEVELAKYELAQAEAALADAQNKLGRALNIQAQAEAELIEILG